MKQPFPCTSHTKITNIIFWSELLTDIIITISPSSESGIIWINWQTFSSGLNLYTFSHTKCQNVIHFLTTDTSFTIIKCFVYLFLIKKTHLCLWKHNVEVKFWIWLCLSLFLLINTNHIGNHIAVTVTVIVFRCVLLVQSLRR